MRRGVAQQDGLALAAEQRGGDGLGGVGGVALQRRLGVLLVADHGGDVGQRLDPIASFDTVDVAGQRHRPRLRVVVREVVDHRHPRSRAHGTAQAQREQRMVLPQVGAEDQRALQRRQRRDARAQPTNALARREFGVAQAVVDVLAAQRAHQLLSQEQFFHGAVRADQRAEAFRTVVALDLAQAVGHVFERGLPVHRLPRAALLDHGGGQAVGAVERFIGEAVAVGQPAFVDVVVLEGENAHHLVVLDLDDQVGAGGVVRADRLAARQLPGPRAVAERLAGERADRAQVDHVAGHFGIDRVAQHRGDLGVLAAVDHAQLHHAGHFLAEAHAAGAVDAAAHLLHADQRADVLVEDDALFFLVARGRAAVADGQVLQLAFAALVADRAVQRVVDQQELHHRLLRLDRLVALGAHDHALRHRRGAGRHRLGRLLHVDQAHAAVGRDAEFLVIAEVRDVGPRLVGRMHDHAAFGDLHLLAVDFQFNHMCFPSLRPWRPLRGRSPE